MIYPRTVHPGNLTIKYQFNWVIVCVIHVSSISTLSSFYNPESKSLIVQLDRVYVESYIIMPLIESENSINQSDLFKTQKYIWVPLLNPFIDGNTNVHQKHDEYYWLQLYFLINPQKYADHSNH